MGRHFRTVLAALLFLALTVTLPALVTGGSTGLVECSQPGNSCTNVTQICSNSNVSCSTQTVSFTCTLVCQPSAAPVAPVAGYSAWFVADQLVFQDNAATIPATANGDTASAWKGDPTGSYQILGAAPWTWTPGGYTAGILRTGANGINGRAAIDTSGAGASLYTERYGDSNLFNDASKIMGATGGTVFSVHKAALSPLGNSIWGCGCNLIGSYYTINGSAQNVLRSIWYNGTTSVNAEKIVSDDGLAHVLTFHVDTAAGFLYAGRDDTRTASMASAAITGTGGNVPQSLTVASGYGGGEAGGLTAEIVAYPTPLSEANRKLVEQYLATKYGITLPY